MFHNDAFLSGIQLFFTNGVQSPCFETRAAAELKDKFQTITVDPTLRIAQLSVKIYKNKWISGLKIVGSDGSLIADVTWCARTKEGKWVTEKIPEGKEIIGVQCNNSANKWYIGRIGFQLWTPNPHTEEEKAQVKPKVKDVLYSKMTSSVSSHYARTIQIDK